MPENKTENCPARVMEHPMFALLSVDLTDDHIRATFNGHIKRNLLESKTRFGDTWLIELNAEGIILLSGILGAPKSASIDGQVPMRMAFYDKKPPFQEFGHTK